MKKIFTFSTNFFLALLFLTLANTQNIQACGCNCGTLLVIFEWNGSEFIPKGGDPKGITITNVITPPGQPGKPMKVT